MAQSSGRVAPQTAIEGFDRALFTHRASGFRYRVSKRSGGALSVGFEQPAAAGGLHAEKAMPYYVGSGAAARSYLLESDGFLFVSPVAWYSGSSAHWGLGPAYSGYGYPFLTRPALPGCLTCHASFLSPIAGTQNRFADPPFAEGGVACERCHGPGEAHIAAAGKSKMVNPAQLSPDRRDSICAQCHLSGEMRVMRPGKDWQSYHPGDRLSDSLTVFVDRAPRRTVTSHVENLAQSACQRASGDKLWCGSCHDAHSVPAPAARATYFRSKCLGCHAQKPGYRAHGDDCVSCHMPKGSVADAEHVVFADHSIPRRPRPPIERASSSPFELAAFGPAPATRRDTALAYAMASTRQPSVRETARELLEAVVSTSPDDAEVLLYLAEIYRNSGLDDRALPLYERASVLDPSQLTASTGMGAIYFQRGDLSNAVRHWQAALAKNPGLVLVATNLAMAQWRQGDRPAAEATLRRVLDLSPGFKPAADLLKQVRTRSAP